MKAGLQLVDHGPAYGQEKCSSLVESMAAASDGKDNMPDSFADKVSDGPFRN
jgi:hypothetical protein